MMCVKLYPEKLAKHLMGLIGSLLAGWSWRHRLQHLRNGAPLHPHYKDDDSDKNIPISRLEEYVSVSFGVAESFSDDLIAELNLDETWRADVFSFIVFTLTGRRVPLPIEGQEKFLRDKWWEDFIPETPTLPKITEFETLKEWRHASERVIKKYEKDLKGKGRSINKKHLKWLVWKLVEKLSYNEISLRTASDGAGVSRENVFMRVKELAMKMGVNLFD